MKSRPTSIEQASGSSACPTLIADHLEQLISAGFKIGSIILVLVAIGYACKAMSCAEMPMSNLLCLSALGESTYSNAKKSIFFTSLSYVFWQAGNVAADQLTNAERKVASDLYADYLKTL